MNINEPDVDEMIEYLWLVAYKLGCGEVEFLDSVSNARAFERALTPSQKAKLEEIYRRHSL